MMKRFLKAYLIMVNIITIVICVGVPIAQVVIPEYKGENYSMFLVALLVAVLFVNIFYKRVIERIDLREKRKIESKYREYLLKELELDEEKSSIVEQNKFQSKEATSKQNMMFKPEKRSDKKDILALMLKNNDEITEYFRISKIQAKSSFWFSVISCIVGLISLIVGIYGIVILGDISVSVISLVSGSVSELISGTIFWVHNKSALQLNHYYDALHENEKFLSAVNIADKLGDERREEMYIEIIRTQINIKKDK